MAVLTPPPLIPIGQRFRAPLDRPTFGIGGPSLDGRDAPIGSDFASVAKVAPYIRQAGVLAAGGGGAHYTMGSFPLIGSVVIVAISGEASTWSSHSIAGCGVRTWNQVDTGKTNSGAGACSQSMAWGVVGQIPSAYFTAYLNGNVLDGDHACYMEIVGLEGVQIYGETKASTNSNPATATFANYKARVPGGFLVIADISQNGSGAISNVTPAFVTDATAAVGARVGLIAHSPIPYQCNSSGIAPTITATGSNSKIVGTMLHIR